MLQKHFGFLPGIKEKTEEILKKNGVIDWNSFISAKHIKGISPIRKSYYDRVLVQAKKALWDEDSCFFTNKLKETWLLYEHFKEESIFLDIETTGLSDHDKITMIGLFDGIDTRIMVKDINLDYNYLRGFLKNYKLMITFNGSIFDLPFIRKRMPDLLPPIPHIDLRHLCAKVGLTGGLKNIERKLGIRRKNNIVENMYGGDAIKLWRMYKASGDEHYLNLLVEYNEEDIINMKFILEKAIEIINSG